jgi:hypothetical protein
MYLGKYMEKRRKERRINELSEEEKEEMIKEIEKRKNMCNRERRKIKIISGVEYTLGAFSIGLILGKIGYIKEIDILEMSQISIGVIMIINGIFLVKEEEKIRRELQTQEFRIVLQEEEVKKWKERVKEEEKKEKEKEEIFREGMEKRKEGRSMEEMKEAKEILEIRKEE